MEDFLPILPTLNDDDVRILLELVEIEHRTRKMKTLELEMKERLQTADFLVVDPSERPLHSKDLAYTQFKMRVDLGSRGPLRSGKESFDTLSFVSEYRGRFPDFLSKATLPAATTLKNFVRTSVWQQDECDSSPQSNGEAIVLLVYKEYKFEKEDGPVQNFLAVYEYDAEVVAWDDLGVANGIHYIPLIHWPELGVPPGMRQKKTR